MTRPHHLATPRSSGRLHSARSRPEIELPPIAPWADFGVRLAPRQDGRRWWGQDTRGNRPGLHRAWASRAGGAGSTILAPGWPGSRGSSPWGRGAVAAGALALAVSLGQAAAGHPWLSSTTYLVQAGDNLTSIAQRFGTSVQALAAANGLSDPNYVQAGTTLTIPGSAPIGAGSTYLVQAGDNLTSIAQRFGTSVQALAAANGLSDPNYVQAGTTLQLPSAAGGAGGTTAGTMGSGGSYLVQAGDNLTSIAQRLGTSVQALAAANGLSDPNYVQAGTTLQLPSAAGGPTNPSPLAGTLPASLWQHSERMVLMPVFQQAAAQAGIPVNLLEGLTWQESGWQPGVVSVDGAMGIGQLMPQTVDFVNNQLLGARLDPWSATDNITMTAWFLRHLLDQTGWNERLAVAAYYQGLKSVMAEGMLPETKHYVADVMALAALF
jgi:LysM repeat protein